MDSSYLTTFNTPFGRFRWLRLPFGVKTAPKEYQRRSHESLQSLNGIEDMVAWVKVIPLKVQFKIMIGT